MPDHERRPRVMIIYYSFSDQTRRLLRRLADGLREQGVHVIKEELRMVKPFRFPVGSVPATLKLMVTTLFRHVEMIEEISPACFADADLMILAGPTWSYNPSGPVLALLQRDGRRLFADRTVIPLISCRGYWRTHWYGLRHSLRRYGATLPNLIVFTHPCPEPWRTIGVFLKIAGKKPEQSVLGRFYPRYGHTREQHEEAWRFGNEIGKALRERKSLADLDFKTSLAMP